MSRPRRGRAAALLIAGLAWLAAAPAPAQDVAPDGLAILPPPPARGSPRDRADRAVFAATRKLQGSARWRIAADDVENKPLDRYACAMDVRIAPGEAPLLESLLDRVGTGALVDPVKTHYHRPRPYLGTAAPICQPKTAALAHNGDYPSGHAANGWLEGLVLAELFPDRATEILARARAYGESRAICGAHSASAVEAGWMAGSAMAAVLHGSAAFRRDMDAARAEVETVRRSAARPDAARCRSEQAVLARPAF